MANKRVVIGIVETPAEAEHTVERLVTVGFARDDVSTLFPDRHGPHDFGFEPHTRATEGALAGAIVGAVLGASLGMFAGIGLVDLPILRDLTAAGPLVAALACAAAIAMVTGMVGALLGLRVPVIHAKHYEGKLQSPSIVIAVHTEGRRATRIARDVFRAVAASGIHATTESALPIGMRG